MAENECWRAAEARSRGLPAPEDPRACYAPRPAVTYRADQLLDLTLVARRQLRSAGMGGIVGFDWSVIIQMAEDAGIARDMAWYEALSIIEGVAVEAMNPKPENAATGDEATGEG